MRVSWLEVFAYPVRYDIVRSLVESPNASASELAAKSNISDATLRHHLRELVSLGLVHEHRGVKDSVTPGRPAARFSLYPEVREAARALLEILTQPVDTWPR